MGVREVDFCPEVFLLDLCNDVQALDNSHRRLGVFGLQSSPIAGLKLLVLQVKLGFLRASGVSQKAQKKGH